MTDSRCNIYPRKAHEVMKGDFIILRNRPCRVVEVHHAKSGKHGHCKARLVGIDLLDNGKLDWTGAGHLQVYGFEPIKQQLLFLALEEATVSCLDDASKELSLDMPADHPLRPTLADPE
jgi:translation initiation factor 5A